MPPKAATDSGKIEYTTEPCELEAKRSTSAVAASDSIGGGGGLEIQLYQNNNKIKEIHRKQKR